MLLRKKIKSGNAPLSAADCCKRGQQELADDNLSYALEYYQAALEFDNENVEALQGLQSVWQRMGKHQKADEVQKRLDMLQTKQSNSSIQNSHLNPKKWSLRMPTKVSKESMIVVALVVFAYLGVFFSPLITVSMDSRYELPGYIPFYVNHLITTVPSFYWMFKKKTSIKTRSFLLGILIPIPVFSGVLFAFYEQQTYFPYFRTFDVDFSSIIWFAVIVFLIDFLLTLFLLTLTESMELKKCFFSKNWIVVLIGMLLSSFILLSLAWLMWRLNVVETLANVMGNVIAIVGMIVIVIILFIVYIILSEL